MTPTTEPARPGPLLFLPMARMVVLTLTMQLVLRLARGLFVDETSKFAPRYCFAHAGTAVLTAAASAFT